MRVLLRTAILVVVGLATFTTFADTPDLVIRHGSLVDGTGRPARAADIAIQDGRIVEIGTITGLAAEEIDATGMIVAPGFIDVHTHAENLWDLPRAENFVRLGVTTVVLGNCGSSELDIGKFFRRLEAYHVSVNVATLIGHGVVREKVMGRSAMRPPTTDELDAMKKLVDQAMEEGAMGISTGLIYVPGVFAKTEEIVALAKVAARHHGIYTSHMRNEGAGIFDALDELFRVAREAGIRAHVSHIKLSDPASWGRAGRVLAEIEVARASGLEVTQDQYVYTASSTGISQLIPDWALAGKDVEFNRRIASASEKARIISEMKERLNVEKRDDYSYAVIADYSKDRSLNGKAVPQASQLRRGSSSLEAQIELILEIQANGGALGVFHGMSETDLRQFLGHTNTAFASDSSVHKLQEGVPHPRGYGNNARVLAQYVRKLKLLPLEEAIRRMTSLPAAIFQIQDRGQLRVGNRADIVVFDPAKIQDLATFEDPHRYATGFTAVLVNGVLVVKGDQHTKARPGQVVRHQP